MRGLRQQHGLMTMTFSVSSDWMIEVRLFADQVRRALFPKAGHHLAAVIAGGQVDGPEALETNAAQDTLNILSRQSAFVSDVQT